MPIIGHMERKSRKGKMVVAGIYLALIVGGITMVYPFLVMITGSVSATYDYERRSPIPRFLYSREDRFMRLLCCYFPLGQRNAMNQMRSTFPDQPETWQTWVQMGDEMKSTDKWARKQIHEMDDPVRRKQIEAAARDYGDFARNWDPEEAILSYDQRYVSPFLQKRYGTLDRFNAAWHMSVDDFYKVQAVEWSGEPIDQASYVPIRDERYTDLLAFRQAYRTGRYAGYMNGPSAPASFLRPASMRYLWEEYVAKRSPSRPKGALEFPVSAEADRPTLAMWTDFLKTGLPMRHVAIKPSEGAQTAYRGFLRQRFHNLADMNSLLETSYRSWDEIMLATTTPSKQAPAQVWMDFVRKSIPVESWSIRDTLADQAFQQFALKRHGSLDSINAAYGTKLTSIRQLKLPLREAILFTFAHKEWAFTLDGIVANYRMAWDYLFRRGRALYNTLVLVVLSLLVSLTVNPMAGYALSRFRLRATEKVLVFCLGTMAFPAAISAIPGFLLLRDLGLLNTFAALVLPAAANGMTIFLLKGFFDSLPMELYEAAAIDGAPEWQVFTKISLPLVKPILAVGMLGAFLAAYNGWEWAIVVCQNPKMWTIAVWTFQLFQVFPGQQYVSMAAFVLTSIPVLIVFILCQRVILHGIILPQMK